MSQRSGPLASHIRTAKNVYSPLIPLMTTELILGFEPLKALRMAVKFLARGGNVIINTRTTRSVEVNIGGMKYPPPKENT